MNKKLIILLTLGIFLSIYLLGDISAVCCEKTEAGDICQNVASAEYCDSDYDINGNLACSSTTFCSTGTCVDRTRGECVPSTRAACNPSQGGYFYEQPIEEVTECQKVCCIVNGPDYVEKVTCNSIGSEYNIQPEIIEGISALECYSLADADVMGACVIENNLGRDCDMTTKSDCTGEFHKGLLCTAQDLGTICVPSEKTTCIEGKNEVYFKDTCGNNANIYDSSKINPINWDYWTYLKNPYEDPICNDGSGNKYSSSCGNCNYIEGSTCGLGNSADYGDYICQDIDCKEGELAEKFNDLYDNFPKNGDSWCIDSLGDVTNIRDFENAVPGQTSFRASCYMGEIQFQLGNQYRNKICFSQRTEDTKKINAVFIPNRWQDCTFQNNTADCENTDRRDCRVLEGVNMVQSEGMSKKFINSSTDKEIRASCVPKYSPGLNFWEPTLDIASQGDNQQKNTESVCQIGTSICGAAYSGEYENRVTDWEWDAYSWECAIEKDCMNKEKQGEVEDCVEGCGGSLCFGNEDSDKVPKNPNIKQSWILNSEKLCQNMGDCGAKSNYHGFIGYNIWDDLIKMIDTK